MSKNKNKSKKLSRSEEALMVRRATRLAALQILYGQQFKGETIYQTDPYLSEDDDGNAGEGGGDIGKARSDRVFLAKLLSCARTHRRVLQGWLSGRIVGRSWENVDLLLRLIMWLGISEMVLVSMEGAGKGIVGGSKKVGLGRLAGEYCGMASLFYDDAGVIGLVNGVLDGASRVDLGEVLRGGAGEKKKGEGEAVGDVVKGEG